MTRMNYGLNHSRDLTVRDIEWADRQRLRAKRLRKAKGFFAKYPGRCATCKSEFPRLTLVQKNKLGMIVHSGGCPSKGGSKR
jgi:hypothetical protein